VIFPWRRSPPKTCWSCGTTKGVGVHMLTIHKKLIGCDDCIQTLVDGWKVQIRGALDEQLRKYEES
jgi:hypothetical protein